MHKLIAAAVTTCALLLGHAAAAGAPGAIPYLGVATDPVEPGLARHMDLPEGVGLEVTYTDPDGPAASRVEPGDILLRLNDQVLVSHRQLAIVVRRRQPGDEVRLVLLRRGGRQEVTVTLAGRPYSPLPPAGGMPDAPRWRRGLPDPLPPRLFRTAPPAADPGAFREELDRMMDRMGVGGMSMDDLFRWMETGPGAAPEGDVAARVSSVRAETRDGKTAALRNDNGRRTFTVTNDEGETLFEGPADTEEDIDRIPAEFRERFRHLAGEFKVNVRRGPVAPPPGAM